MTRPPAPRPDPYVSVPHAAQLLSVTRNTIYNWLAQGKIKGERIAGRMVVLRASLEQPFILERAARFAEKLDTARRGAET